MTNRDLQKWLDAIPEGYQFAFVVVTYKKDEEHIELSCNRSFNGSLQEALKAFDETEKVLKESKRQFLKERALEYLENLLTREED